MSSFVYMKVLESTPERYDRGMRLLTHGHIVEVYERIAALAATPGARVLDVGCGTGGVTLACAARGAHAIGIDANTGMLEVARAKPVPAEHGGGVEWVELGAAELEDRFSKASFDAAVSCLAFSELSLDEQRYVLRTLRSLLRPGGRLVIVDEERPRTWLARLAHRIRRWPVEALTFLLTQTSTRAVRELAERVREAGFQEVERTPLGFRDLVLVAARRPCEGEE